MPVCPYKGFFLVLSLSPFYYLVLRIVILITTIIIIFDTDRHGGLSLHILYFQIMNPPRSKLRGINPTGIKSPIIINSCNSRD